MRYRIKLLIPLLLLVSLSGCSKDAIRNAREALADIAVGLKTGDKSVQALYGSQVISVDEARRLEDFIREGTVLNDNLNVCVDIMKQGAEKQAAITCANNVVTQFKAKEAQAVLQIKSKDAQASFNVAIQLVDVGITLLESAMQQLGGKP